jgi:hypothetical protein
MNNLDHLITGFAIVGLVLSAVISYLKVNKLWGRRHIREVSESISVAAALLSLFTTLPFLAKFLIVDRDLVAAGKFLLSLIVFFVFFLVGIGLWVRREDQLGIWQMMRRALATERGELTYLIRSFAKPREAPAILRVLQLVSLVDQDLDERETEMLESVARPWGIHVEELRRGPEHSDVDIGTVRQAFSEYLDIKPPVSQVEKVHDLIRFMVNADRKVSAEEGLILDEVRGAVSAYLSQGSGGRPVVYEVLLVPQHDAQVTAMREQSSDPDLKSRAGGSAFVAGTYYSESFARAICQRYRQKAFFSTVERLAPDGERTRVRA